MVDSFVPNNKNRKETHCWISRTGTVSFTVELRVGFFFILSPSGFMYVSSISMASSRDYGPPQQHWRLHARVLSFTPSFVSEQYFKQVIGSICF